MGFTPSAVAQLGPQAPSAAQQSPLETYKTILGIRSLQNQQQLQQGDIKTQQLQQQGLGLDVQQKQLALQNNQIRQSVLADPNFEKDFQSWQSGSSPQAIVQAPGAQGSSAAVPLYPLAQFLAEKKGLPYFGPGGALETSNALTDSVQKIANLSKTQGDAGTAALTNHSKQLDNFDDLVEPVLAEKDPAKQQQGLTSVQQEIQSHPELYPPEATQHLDKINTIQGLQEASNTSKVKQMLIDDATKQSQAQSAAEAADPVLKLATPEALAAPGAQAAIQAKIADPNTKPSDVPRLQALIPKATVAQKQVVIQKQREDLAQQQVSQGDPTAAGKLLASRALTIDELKLRQATPQFIESAVTAAQKIDPTFKAAEAAAQASIAKAPANQQFFGNADSLLTPGGTLDQLQKAASALPQGQIPVFNKVDNLVSAATGQGPQAAYAASILGVADDYAKVMGGAVGTDTARQQIMQRLDAAQSPAQKAAVVNQFRQQIASQRAGRIGTNPYLKDMYPPPGGAQGGGPTASNAAPPAHVPGGKAAGLTEGATGTGSDGKKYVVKGGVWRPVQ